MADYLVSCEWLKSQKDENKTSDLVVLDVSWSSSKNCQEEYAVEHIPGAAYLNAFDGEHTALYPRNIPTLEQFQKNARAVGVNKDSHVVVYSSSDRCGFFVSGRAWWTFKIFGHQKVSVLDGGLQKWKSVGNETTDKSTEIKPGNFVAKWSDQYYKKFEDVDGNLARKEFQVIDTRSEAQYTGDGHIPGAFNIPMGNLMDENTQQMKSAEDLKKLFSEVGVDLNQPVVSHCNSGMSSCTVALAARMCGNEKAAVFHGGFTEWKSKASEKIEK